MIGDHGLIAKGCRFFEGAVRIPLVVSWPARFRKGLRSNALVELTDILPTILDAAGVKTPEHVQGKSLAPVCEGRASPDRHRDFVRAEYHDTIDMPDHTHATMIRDERYKLVTYHNHRLGELFDLAEDPHELRNLYDEPKYAAERLRLTDKLFDAMMCGIDIGQPRMGRF
jgi:arylsulfatase A-like enzyme